MNHLDTYDDSGPIGPDFCEMASVDTLLGPLECVTWKAHVAGAIVWKARYYLDGKCRPYRFLASLGLAHLPRKELK